MYGPSIAVLAAALITTVATDSQRHNIVWPVLHSMGIVPIHLRDAVEERVAHLVERQAQPDPPSTNAALCDLYDGFFYVTPQNYTWQLQCTTNYDGNQISANNADNYTACITACADYNRALSTPGACLAVTFNGPNHGAQGLCTLWSTVTDVFIAYEEGNVQDSALLIRGPDGTIYATPRADPTFSGAPSQQPTIDPVPTSSQSATTVYSTSVIFVTSCPPGVPSCPALTGSSTTTSAANPPPNTTTPSGRPPTPPSSSTTSFSISDGGVRPVSSAMPSISPPPTFPPSSGVGGQITYTTAKPYTEYLVQVITVCAAVPDPCTVLTETSTLTGYRTQLSCSPGVCTGAMINTAVDAAFTAATCILTT